MEQYISPEEKLPNEGEIVYLILYTNPQSEELREDPFISVYYDGSFLTGNRSIIPEGMVYRWSPTNKFYNPFREAKSLIQSIINEDEDNQGEL